MPVLTNYEVYSLVPTGFSYLFRVYNLHRTSDAIESTRLSCNNTLPNYTLLSDFVGQSTRAILVKTLWFDVLFHKVTCINHTLLRFVILSTIVNACTNKLLVFIVGIQSTFEPVTPSIQTKFQQRHTS